MNNKFLTISSPLDQFEIRDYIIIDAPILANIHISLTNITLYLFIALIIITSLFGITNKFPKFINKNWVLFKECIYDTVNNVVVNQIEKNKGQLYFPFIFSLFIFI